MILGSYPPAKVANVAIAAGRALIRQVLFEGMRCLRTISNENVTLTTQCQSSMGVLFP